MSHELRTPLNSLLILAKLLSDNEESTLTDKQVEYARTIHSAGNDLLSLISQILDLSKIEAGKLQIETKRLALSDVQEYVRGTFRQVAEQKKVEFNVALAPDAPIAMITDTQRLQQILKNLLSNAFKFTEKGRVDLDIRLADPTVPFMSEVLKHADRVVAFAVSDTGIGIPDDKQQMIFEAFQQADSSTSRMYGGTGLGLTISRELAHILGGEIVVNSALGNGSTFTLYLPVNAPRQSEGALELSAGTASSSEFQLPAHIPDIQIPEQSFDDLQGRKVLLIDDDTRNLFAVTSLLERCRMRVVAASSAHEGLAALREHPDMDLVLMDIMLPGMDGYQTTREIRAQPALASLPIIALTAKAMPGDREKCLEAGCSAFVPKPVDTNRLIFTIKQTLN